MKKYMHTLNGKPAYYVKREQIVFAHNDVKLSELFVNDLRTIRRQQKASQQWRQKHVLDDSIWRVGYLRIDE